MFDTRFEQDVFVLEMKCFLIELIFHYLQIESITMLSTVEQQRNIVEQLRRETAIRRVLISHSVQDIVKYIREHENEDYLLKGFSSQKANPFREKSTCQLI